MSQTRIFVSSTCYDLIHIRQALNNHIVALGHLPVMSEFASFPVDPTLSSIENCRNNVRANADVFVLIIGGRRGTIDKQAGKSIVNLEYDSAVQQGLDIFVFVDSAVLNLLPIWKANKDVVLSPTVDSNNVLEFLEKIREAQRWTFPFSKESDISEVLAIQLSGQLCDLLKKRRYGHLDFLEMFKNETPNAISLVQHRNPFWEHLLTAELLESRIKDSAKRYADIQAGRVLGSHKNLTGREFMRWVGEKFPETQCAVHKFKHVFEIEVLESWGPPGISGKSAEILSAAEEFRKVLNALLEIDSDVYRTHGPPATEKLRNVLLGMTEEVFAVAETIPRRLREEVDLACTHRDGDGPLTLSVDLKLEFAKAAEFKSACEFMTQNMKPSDWDSY